MAITLYYTAMGSATRVHWALLELGIPFEKVRVHMDKGEHKTPEYLAINPNGKVPALVDGSLKLFESLAMILHLGDRYGEKGGLWPASGTDARSLAYMLSVYSMVEIQTSVFDYLRHGGNHPRITLPPDKRVKDIADRALATWHTGIKVLHDHLASHEHLLGDGFTLCDCTVASVITVGGMMGGLPVDDKRVQDWVGRCSSRPALAKAMQTGGV
jgi:glutathione S-transferase